MTAERIAALNDRCRKSVPHAQCYLTQSVIVLAQENLNALLKAVRDFSAFMPDNDPYGEHDFGAFEFAGQRLFWKIDTYADASLTYGAEDPLSPKAVRVITIMRADEY